MPPRSVKPGARCDGLGQQHLDPIRAGRVRLPPDRDPDRLDQLLLELRPEIFDQRGVVATSSPRWSAVVTETDSCRSDQSRASQPAEQLGRGVIGIVPPCEPLQESRARPAATASGS